MAESGERPEMLGAAGGDGMKRDRQVWCIECGMELDPQSLDPRPTGHHAPGAGLNPACSFCAQRAATGHVSVVGAST